jgi:formate dehydrogenase iron-sulfur subunit
MSDTTVRTLIDEFLAEQASTTAVERFDRATHAADDRPLPPGVRVWRDLLPATPPAPGQQYAFEVDLDACSGCKACVVACGALNGLDEGVSFRAVGTLIGAELPMLRSITTSCHHCVEPGCLAGCPVDAYEKDPITGIVRHLDDQCIGCRYCTLTCPYEVPRYDADRGIVRKCDLCHDRLSDGEAPACVAACPTQAITVRVVDLEAVVGGAGEPWPLPAPDPAITTPTTRYRTSEDLTRGVVAADADALVPGHAHPPLTVMLVLTQLAVGALLLLVVAEAIPAIAPAEPASGSFAWRLPDEAAVPAALTALATAILALGASTLHLGRPLLAWRAVIGLRHSWLSREIVAFGLFAAAATAYAAAVGGLPPMAGWTTGAGPLATGSLAAGSLAAATGVAGVVASAMVYAVTGRRWWSLPRTLGRFALTAGLGGAALLQAVVTLVGAVTDVPVTSTVAALATATTTLALLGVAAEAGLLRHHAGPATDELARTARLLVRRAPGLVAVRLAGAIGGGVAAPWLAWRMLTVAPTSEVAAAVTATLGLIAVLTGELAERWRFFTAVAPTRMPGRLP